MNTRQHWMSQTEAVILDFINQLKKTCICPLSTSLIYGVIHKVADMCGHVQWKIVEYGQKKIFP